MFRREMADEHGMLFDFVEEQPASFWMENTYIPLDMLFIKADGTVEFDRRAHHADVSPERRSRKGRSASCSRSTAA